VEVYPEAALVIWDALVQLPIPVALGQNTGACGGHYGLAALEVLGQARGVSTLCGHIWIPGTQTWIAQHQTSC
jgi:hypothetical protein